uniref:Epstein-Barr nuclear antigen 1 (EBV nuclear antigen 1) (EBNA-1) n=2 Tax=Arthrobacter sp. J3.49 TaxID=347213 RepID=I3W1J2_9MICC|nr:Epstein-Barr nuclear antigen 1 (EBV nuclear antigen 1) (EBNA-1) [Arthrobacter sp. J3.49]
MSKLFPANENGQACKPWEVGCVVSDWANDRANDAVKNMAQAVADAVGNMVKTLGTFWVNVGTPALTAAPGGSTASDPVLFLQNSLYFWTASLAVMSVLVGAGKMMIERRGAPLRDLVRSLATLIVVSGAGVAAVGLLTVAADQFSAWIITNSTNGTSFNENITALLALSATSPIGSIMIILLGLIAILASVIQIVLMIIRGGLLVILTGIFPTAAAFSNTEAGKGWFQKCTAWLIAFILYKPAAAIIYATAFQLSGSKIFGNAGDGKDFGSALLSTVTGLALMIIALFAMPALMRFVTPMVGAVAGGGGGLAAGAVGALASGAISMGSAGRGGGSSTSSTTTSSTSSQNPGSQGPSGTGSQGTAGTSGTAGKTGTRSAGTTGAASPTGAGSAAAGSGAAASGGAVAAGAGGVAVLAAQKGLEAGQAASGAIKDMSEESTGGA